MAIVTDSNTALTFDAGPHAYTLDGQPVRSVTGLLRKVGLISFDGIRPDVLEDARARGTSVHQAVHYFNEHDLDVLRYVREWPKYAGYLQSWIRLMETGRLQTAFCEYRVASRTPRFAGTLDWLGLFDGRAAVIDFATGRPEDAAKHLQTAGYVLALQTWAKEPGQEALAAFVQAHPFIARYAVQLNKAGTLPKPRPYRDPHDLTLFRRIAELVDEIEREKPKSQPWDW